MMTEGYLAQSVIPVFIAKTLMTSVQAGDEQCLAVLRWQIITKGGISDVTGFKMGPMGPT